MNEPPKVLDTLPTALTQPDSDRRAPMSLSTPEQWRPVVGFEQLYDVSDQGRIRSHYRHSLVLKLIPNKDGYLIARLHKDGRIHYLKAHRLVADAFCDKADGTYEIRHMNGIPDDNRVENLRWGTRTENVFDVVRHGRHRNARKTHCLRGHEFTPENTDSRRNRHGKDGREWRDCRTCKRLRNRKTDVLPTLPVTTTEVLP